MMSRPWPRRRQNPTAKLFCGCRSPMPNFGAPIPLHSTAAEPCLAMTAPRRHSVCGPFPGAMTDFCSTASGSSCSVPVSTTTTAFWVPVVTPKRRNAKSGCCKRWATTLCAVPITPVPRHFWMPATGWVCWSWMNTLICGTSTRPNMTMRATCPTAGGRIWNPLSARTTAIRQ